MIKVEQMWVQCEKCGEHVPTGQLTFDADEGKSLCDVCIYELYVKRRNDNAMYE